MRFHTDSLTPHDVEAACIAAGVTLADTSVKGSRSRKYAREIKLYGTSSYRTMDGTGSAATWDEWGIFIAELFRRDPNMTVPGTYESASVFHMITGGRFHELTALTQHRKHNWTYIHGSSYHECECSAVWGHFSKEQRQRVAREVSFA